MPSQEELDREQKRTQSESGTIGTIRRGGIYDIETQPSQDDNKEGTNERIQNDGIDRIKSGFDDSNGGGGRGLPDGYEEVLRDYVDDQNAAAQEYYLTRQP